MAEELYDGEFWLPSEILTDDDILMDFFGSGSGSGSYSSSEPGSVSSDDELKAPVLLTSPKSTLFGCASPNRPVSPPKDDQTNNNNNNNNNNNKTTLNLLNKAAGEVAKIKGEKSAGTGFFDCSNTSKRNSVPPPSQPAQQTFTYFAPPVYYYPQFSPYMNWAQVPVPVPVQAPPQKQKQEKKASKNKSSSASKKSNEGNNSGINSTLDLSPAAWPPLPGQGKSQPEPQPQPALQTQPMPRTSVGTGVFFPRVIASPATEPEPEPEPKMKSDETVNATKTKKKKGSKRSNSCPVEVNLDDIQLPSEWVY